MDSLCRKLFEYILKASKSSPGTPLDGVEKWGPGRFEFLDAICTHINIKLEMGIQTRMD